MLDLCAQVDSVEYRMPGTGDLAETARLVETLGRRIIAVEGDVRDYDMVNGVVERTVAELGRFDIVVANAGIMPTTGEPSRASTPGTTRSARCWPASTTHLCASMNPMIETGNGGSMVITSSTAGLSGIAYNAGLLNPGEMGYGAAKHGVVGLMRNFVRALGPHKIRVNSVHTMGVRTPMLSEEFFVQIMNAAPPGGAGNVLGIDLIEPEDVSNAMLWLVSDDARYVTGSTVPVDGGQLVM